MIDQAETATEPLEEKVFEKEVRDDAETFDHGRALLETKDLDRTALEELSSRT